GIGIFATFLAVAIAIGSYAWNSSGTPDAVANGPAPAPSSLSPAQLQLLAGAQAMSQTFLRNLGAGDPHTCFNVLSGNVITTVASPRPISCAKLMAQRGKLLPGEVVSTMRTAAVMHTSGMAVGQATNGPGFDGAPQTGEGPPSSHPTTATSENGVSAG